ncbi:MAG: hypothetical protein IKW39_05655 [Alphaproteobacteria bacterium]|nr:hypothetical protein [Alphaproteobacteria bacterium]
MGKMRFFSLIYFFIFSFFILSCEAKATQELDIFGEITENKNESLEQKKDTKDDLSYTEIISGKKEVKERKEEKEKINADANASESWLKSLFKQGKSELKLKMDKEAQMNVEKIKKQLETKQRSNAAHFDISGIKLRMTPKEVEEILKNQGYKKIMESMEIPNFIEWRAEELCRINGVVGFERLNACMTKIAQHHGYQFVEKQVYNRHLTKESIEVNYTSSFTDNLSYRIHYKSSIRMSESKASKNVYINNLKVFDFWKRIDLKYGEPDNTTEVKWGLGGKKPYMKAKTGELELMDPLLIGLDSTRMYNEDSRFANTQYYTF